MYNSMRNAPNLRLNLLLICRFQPRCKYRDIIGENVGRFKGRSRYILPKSAAQGALEHHADKTSRGNLTVNLAHQTLFLQPVKLIDQEGDERSAHHFEYFLPHCLALKAAVQKQATEVVVVSEEVENMLSQSHEDILNVLFIGELQEYGLGVQSLSQRIQHRLPKRLFRWEVAIEGGLG